MRRLMMIAVGQLLAVMIALGVSIAIEGKAHAQACGAFDAPAVYSGSLCNAGGPNYICTITSGVLTCSLERNYVSGPGSGALGYLVANYSTSSTYSGFGVDANGMKFCCKYSSATVTSLEMNGTRWTDNMFFVYDDGFIHRDLLDADGSGGITGTMNGKLANDTIEGSWATTLFTEVIHGDGDNDTIDGNPGDDTIYGDSGNDTIYGGSGDDNIYGYGDSDTLYGDDGADAIYGGLGTDTIYGGAGEDTLNGENSGDTIYGGDDEDVIDGGDANDKIKGDAADDTLLGGGDTDIICDDNNDTIDGGNGVNTMWLPVTSSGSITGSATDSDTCGHLGSAASFVACDVMVSSIPTACSTF